MGSQYTIKVAACIENGLRYLQLNGSTTVTDRNPIPTVDIIIAMSDRPHRPIILIEHRNEPYGWTIPGSFMNDDAIGRSYHLTRNLNR